MRVGVLLALIVLTGCTTTKPEKFEMQSSAGNSGFVEIGLKENSRLGKGYFVLLESNSGRWTAVSARREAHKVKWQKKGQEVLFVSENFKYVQPYFEKLTHFNSMTFNCDYFSDDDKVYSPCSSQFTDTNLTMSLAKNVIAIPFSWGTAVGSHQALDKEKILEAVEEANLFSFINDEMHRLANVKDQQEIELAKIKKRRNYRRTFNEAKTSTDYTNFINRYQNYDPDLLVNQAIQLRDVALTKELEAEARRQAEAAERERERKQQRLKEQKRIERIKTFASTYRKSFKVGVETNCGPIVALNGDMVKIYAPVQGYGNEHWIHREKLYHPVVGCNFLNGHYIAPL